MGCTAESAGRAARTPTRDAPSQQEKGPPKRAFLYFAGRDRQPRIRVYRSTPNPTPPELSEPENAAPMLTDTLSLMRRP